MGSFELVHSRKRVVQAEHLIRLVFSISIKPNGAWVGHVHSKRTREDEEGCIYCSPQKMTPALRIQSIIEVAFVIPVVNEIGMKQWTHRRTSEHAITDA